MIPIASIAPVAAAVGRSLVLWLGTSRDLSPLALVSLSSELAELVDPTAGHAAPKQSEWSCDWCGGLVSRDITPDNDDEPPWWWVQRAELLFCSHQCSRGRLAADRSERGALC